MNFSSLQEWKSKFVMADKITRRKSKAALDDANPLCRLGRWQRECGWCHGTTELRTFSSCFSVGACGVLFIVVFCEWRNLGLWGPDAQRVCEPSAEDLQNSGSQLVQLLGPSSHQSVKSWSKWEWFFQHLKHFAVWICYSTVFSHSLDF